MIDQEENKLSLQAKMDKISQEISKIEEHIGRIQKEKPENGISEEEHENEIRSKIMYLQEEISHLEYFQYTLSKIVAVIDSKITDLNLSRSSLSDVPAEVWKLSQLKTLNLSGNNLKSLPDEIGQLANLNSLDLSNNSLATLPSSIGLLNRLESLNLESNNLQELPAEMGEFKTIKKLVLTDNSLKSLPPEIGNLYSLEIIDLRFNTELRDLPSNFWDLTNLRELYLSDNYLLGEYIDTLLDNVCGFERLKILELVNIGITSIPPQFSNLKELEDLAVNYNNISDLPTEFSQLMSLKNLDLNGNDFVKIPECVYELRNLESLYMSENSVNYIDSRISNLKQLKNLSFGTQGKGLMIESSGFDATNQIREIPRSIKNLKNLEELDLTGNPLPIPEEILIRSNEPEAIINYYWTLKFLGIHEKQILECKFNVVGQGSVGKTSLVQQILYSSFNQDQAKTDGISVNKWQIEQYSTHETKSQIQLNIWDFGGQEIMHATHQFFLTKRSLYLLVIDSRLTQEENRVEYWLKIIQSFGGESPVLLVGNKIDQHPLDIDRTGLQKKYPNIVGILETSAATGTGIEELKAVITEQVNNLPHVRDLLPETWFTVKTKLEELGKQSNFITHDKYLDLCFESEVSDETSQRTLIGFLHDLGVVLHFQDDPRLEALGILNPQWVTNGVYKILNSHTLFQNKGVLTTSMLDEILNLPEYPRGKRLFIVDMMKKFELCYDIEPDKTFLVPDLLPKDEPATDGRENALAFQYHYTVLPSSVITRFIVRMSESVGEKVWRTGAILKDGGNTALVKADIEDRKIFIWVSGDEHKRHDFLSKIRGQFDGIHKTISKLEVKEMVPVPGHLEAEPVDYDLLLQMDHNNVEVYPVLSGGKMIVVKVREMLNGVARESDRQRGNVTNFYIGGDVKDSTIIAGDENEVKK